MKWELKNRPVPGLLIALLLLAAIPAGAATITIVNADGVGEGFNDPNPLAAVTGNTGTTVGQQRLNAFAAAAAYWANRLSSSVAITVHAQMNPLSCSPTSGVIGSAGAADFFSDFPNAPRAATWYASALANKLAGFDLDTSSVEINAQFNSSVGNATCLTGLNWWYGVGGTAPTNTISFYETIRHELAHGLGFLTIVNPATGARALGQDDAFMLFLEDHSTGKTWGQMSDPERVVSAKDPGDLHWVGPKVVAASSALLAGRHPSGHVQMYAPATLQQGSSVSHWDTALTPDEIMEPNATLHPADIVTTQLLEDIGWTLQQTTGACIPDVNTACLQSGRFEVKVDWQSATATGASQVMSFNGQQAQSDESVFWWFFSPTNFEMGVKVLNACTFNSKFWVYLSGLTDQGWTVHVRDTQTGATQTYANTLGQLSKTFADTSAFNCP
ncbi:MAG TPA: hypothetical protein VIA62_11385 [Thermoanaerobaculia bacterium]|nr:hypothetical protein [Thermoanaerobaculia bacterium]